MWAFAVRAVSNNYVRQCHSVPSPFWSDEDVGEALEQATKRSGVPRVIVDDHGSDLHSGVQLFQKRHAETAEIYDAKHKAAC